MAGTVGPPVRPRRTRHAPAKRIVGAALASVLLLGGCYAGPGADHFDAVLDELSTPEGWSLAKSVTMGPGEKKTCDPFVSTGCPTAIRTYLTEGDTEAASAQAMDMVGGAGFDIEDGAAGGCSGGSSTVPACSLFAHRGDDDLTVVVYVSPRAAGLEDDTPGVVTVVIQASSSE